MKESTQESSYYVTSYFAESGQLKKHEGIHTGEKPFACSKCDKSFTQSGKLKMHEMTHSRERVNTKLCFKQGHDSFENVQINNDNHKSFLEEIKEESL